MRQEVRWTDLTYGQIAEHLAEAGTPVSVPVVKQLLDEHDYVTRKAQKSKAMGGHAMAGCIAFVVEAYLRALSGPPPVREERPGMGLKVWPGS